MGAIQFISFWCWWPSWLSCSHKTVSEILKVNPSKICLNKLAISVFKCHVNSKPISIQYHSGMAKKIGLGTFIKGICKGIVSKRRARAQHYWEKQVRESPYWEVPTSLILCSVGECLLWGPFIPGLSCASVIKQEIHILPMTPHLEMELLEPLSFFEQQTDSSILYCTILPQLVLPRAQVSWGMLMICQGSHILMASGPTKGIGDIKTWLEEWNFGPSDLFSGVL